MAIVGIIGVGVVGGTLNKWLKNHTDHKIKLYDPLKGHLDSLEYCDAIFISVPVHSCNEGQNTSILEQSIELAKKHTDKVFIRSTVLPGTNDKFGTISMPEFLTERRAYEDMCKYPILSGETDLKLLERIFPNKKIIMMKNKEAELAKYTHNCFGAMKVTYFNIINKLCESFKLNYENVLKGAMITGFIEPQHTKIAQDGKKGYGGSCFPENIISFREFLCKEWFVNEEEFFRNINVINQIYRKEEIIKKPYAQDGDLFD